MMNPEFDEPGEIAEAQHTSPPDYLDQLSLHPAIGPCPELLRAFRSFGCEPGAQAITPESFDQTVGIIDQVVQRIIEQAAYPRGTNTVDPRFRSEIQLQSATLFGQHVQGDVSRGDALFLCHRESLPRNFRRLWLIDADDTLWEDNIHFEALIAQFSELVISSGAPLDYAAIRAIVDEVEHKNIPIYGFGADGFALSIRESWDTIRSEFHVPAAPELEEFFATIVPFLQRVPHDIPIDSYRFLTQLPQREPYDGIILFTQGPLYTQARKILNSGLANLFDGIAIGSNKKASTYSELLGRFPASAQEIVVVGNSLNSEVRPAIELGWRAFHFDNPNSWHHVNSNPPNPAFYTRVSSLCEIFESLDSSY